MAQLSTDLPPQIRTLVPSCSVCGQVEPEAFSSPRSKQHHRPESSLHWWLWVPSDCHRAYGIAQAGSGLGKDQRPRCELEPQGGRVAGQEEIQVLVGEDVGTSQPLLSSLQRSKSQQGALEAKSWQVQAAAELGRWEP